MHRIIRSRIIAAAIIAAVGALALASQDSFNLTRRGKAGESRNFTMSAKVEVMGIEASVSAMVTEKIARILPDGALVLQSDSKQGTIDVMGTQQKIPDSSSSMTIKPTGEIVELKPAEADENSNRREQLASIVLPGASVTTGQKWTHEVKATPLSGNTSGKADYECLGLKTVAGEEAVGIKFSYVETSGDQPASCSGTVWISPKDGWLVLAELNYKAVPLPQAGPSNMSVTVARRK